MRGLQQPQPKREGPPVEILVQPAGRFELSLLHNVRRVDARIQLRVKPPLDQGEYGRPMTLKKPVASVRGSPAGVLKQAARLRRIWLYEPHNNPPISTPPKTRPAGTAREGRFSKSLRAFEWRDFYKPETSSLSLYAACDCANKQDYRLTGALPPDATAGLTADGRASQGRLDRHGGSAIGVVAVEASECHAGRPRSGRWLCGLNQVAAGFTLLNRYRLNGRFLQIPLGRRLGALRSGGAMDTP